MDFFMKNKTQKIHNLFIKRMGYSLLAQLLILGLVLFFFRNYRVHNQINVISDNLLVKDQYTLETIGKYKILGADYALDLELHNLGDMRKIDSVKFVKNIEKEPSNHYLVNTKQFILQKSKTDVYTGISVVNVNGKILGYIIAQKKYLPILSVPIKYDLLLMLLSIIGIFFINFGLLLIPIQKRIEKNTKVLLDFISAKILPDNRLSSMDIEEYKTCALKFIDERNEITRLQKEKLYYEARKNIAEQVAHDMRSPLAAINIVTSGKSSYSSEEITVIKSSASRLNYIANNLMSENRNNEKICKELRSKNSTLQPEAIFFLVDSLVSEKQYEYNNAALKINFYSTEQSHNAFALVYSEELKTVLSNIINNAVEASNHYGEISIQLKCESTYIEVQVKDNGCGIPQEILHKVTQKGFSMGKKNGSGLGLFHALSQIEKIGGTLTIDSAEGIGTTVLFKLPQTPIPSWFCKNITLSENSKLIILDDDPSIHDAWLVKLERFRKVKIINYYNSELILKNRNVKNLADLYLIDYDLSSDAYTGIDIINLLVIHNKAILVTNNFEDKDIRDICEKLNIKILPKPFIKYVPIMTEQSIKEPCYE